MYACEEAMKVALDQWLATHNYTFTMVQSCLCPLLDVAELPQHARDVVHHDVDVRCHVRLLVSLDLSSDLHTLCLACVSLLDIINI